MHTSSMLLYYLQSSVVHAANSLLWENYGEIEDSASAELETVCFFFLNFTKKYLMPLKNNIQSVKVLFFLFIIER